MADKEYFFFTIAFLLAPVIAAQKAASLLCFNAFNRNTLDMWRQYSQALAQSVTMQYLEVGEIQNGLMVLFFRPAQLQKILCKAANAEFLAPLGYGHPWRLDSCLQVLQQRYSSGCPPELGLFLGIPLDDVLSFIRYSGRHYLFNGYWKVYHHPGRARKIFSAYDAAKTQVLDLVESGLPPSHLLPHIDMVSNKKNCPVENR